MKVAKADLSACDLHAILECLQCIHAPVDAAELPMLMLSAISKLISSKVSAFTQVDPVLGESTGCMLPPEPWTVQWIAPRFQANIADHPVIQYAARTRDGQAKAISDFLTPKQFHATGLYREVFGVMGIEDQLSIGMVGSAGLMIGLSFNRARRGFSPRDRQVLNLLRPHLLQAYVHVREMKLLRNLEGHRRGTIIDQLPVGLTCVNGRGEVIWSNDPARAMWRRHFTDAADSIHGLPDTIRLWLRRVQKRPGPPGTDIQELVSGQPGVDLSVRWCSLADGHGVLLFQERPHTLAEPVLDGFGLTAREVDVMRRLVRGLSLADAAAEMKIGRRTVEKHLERIFQKLHVKSRAAACMRVLGQT